MKLQSVSRIFHREKTENNATVLEAAKPKVKTNSEMIHTALNIVKSLASLDSSIDRNKFNAMMGFNTEEIEATVQFLCKAGVLWDSKGRIHVDSSIFNCSRCVNSSLGDGWHRRSLCLANGRSLQIQWNLEGKFCGYWNLKLEV